MSVSIQIQLDRLLFRLKSFAEWDNEGFNLLAKSRVRFNRSFGVDSAGKVLLVSDDFKKCKAWPVNMYAIDPPLPDYPKEP